MGTELAKRYPQFITYFEAEVTKIQKKVQELESCQAAYNAVREVILAFETDWDLRLQVEGTTISLIGTLPSTITYKEVRPFFLKIQDSLINAELYEISNEREELGADGLAGAHSFSAFYPGIEQTWWLRSKGEKLQQVKVALDISYNGLPDLTITKESYTMEGYRLKYTVRS